MDYQFFDLAYTKEHWTTSQCMIVLWITNTIHFKVLSMLSKYENAKILCDDLHERFSIINGPRIHQLKL